MNVQVVTPRLHMPHVLAPSRRELVLATLTRRRRQLRRRAIARALRSPRVLVPAGVLTVAALAVAAGWSRRHRLLAVVADAVEEVADTIEDAAEDVAAAARAREGEG